MYKQQQRQINKGDTVKSPAGIAEVLKITERTMKLPLVMIRIGNGLRYEFTIDRLEFVASGVVAQ